MGLIQVLVVAGLVGMISVAIASLLTSSLRGQRAIEVRDAVRFMETEILIHLAQQAACTASLRNLNPKSPGTAVSLLKRADDSTYVTVGDLVQNQMLKLSQMNLSLFTPDHASAPLQGKSKLFLTFEPLGDPVGPKIFTREITLATTINLSDQLTSCSAISSSGSQYWLASPFVMNAIYTAVDAVGIGTNSPAARLDVAGEVKFGNSNSSCDASREGQQRYNSTSKKMEACDGTTWRPMSGSAASGGMFWVRAGSTFPSCPSGFEQIAQCVGTACAGFIFPSGNFVTESGASQMVWMRSWGSPGNAIGPSYALNTTICRQGSQPIHWVRAGSTFPSCPSGFEQVAQCVGTACAAFFFPWGGYLTEYGYSQMIWMDIEGSPGASVGPNYASNTSICHR